jgi:RNA polymerase sigma-70 factor, ECF subfamily
MGDVATEWAAPPANDEAELIRHAQRDRAAFGALYDRTVDAVYAYAYRHQGDHHQAQDVTAETYRRALEMLGRYEQRGRPFLAWLFSIAARVAHERTRATKGSSLEAQPNLLAQLDADDPPALDGIIQHEEHAALWELVATLTPQHQRILILRYAQEKEYTEIAPMLGKTPAAAKQLAYRALGALRAAALASGMWDERRHRHVE